MASDLAWRPLPLLTSSGVPVLLASFDVGVSNYTLRVTDMASMWTESLERKAICMRAWGEDTSIDPSDTTENMAKFLTSLKAALDASQAGHTQTTLGIFPASEADAGKDGLILKITCELPGFLPLKWPMHLRRSPPSAIATDLVLPLIQAQNSRNREVESLIQSLDHKDAVLTKVLDKLEATGTSLEHVFTSLSGRKKVTRTVAEDKVRGLAPFNRRKWNNSLQENESGAETASDLVQSVFGGEGLQYNHSIEVDQSPELDSWWQEFKGTSQTAQRPQPESARPKQRTPSPTAPLLNTDDDDFQVQLTPPQLKSARKRAATSNPNPRDDASTEEEEASVIPDIHTSPAVLETQQLPGRTKPAPRLGTIGRKVQPARAHSPTPETSPAVKEPAAKMRIDSETASEAEDDEATASLSDDTSPRAPPSPKLASPKKGVMGRIGGQKPRPPVEQPDMLAAGNAEMNALASASGKPKKFGVIGKKTGGVTLSTNDSVGGATDRGRSEARVSEHDPQAQEPRETSQERADRRREELKRDLEKKAAAGPAKKKRKF